MSCDQIMGVLNSDENLLDFSFVDDSNIHPNFNLSYLRSYFRYFILLKFLCDRCYELFF